MILAVFLQTSTPASLVSAESPGGWNDEFGSTSASSLSVMRSWTLEVTGAPAGGM
jgi:hypothetical protein